MKAKVSVIVPCYNAETDLRRCLDSLVGQTLKELEIVVVNDGSVDQTESIILEYQEKFPRKIVYVSLKENAGLGNARNVGMKKASGEYLGFVDSDDYVELGMFHLMYQQASRDHADVVECDFVWEYSTKEREDVGKPYQVGKEMLRFVRVMACNKIYRRTMIEEAKAHFAVGLKYEDILFTYQYVPYVKKVSFIRLPFYHYVQRPNSLANHQTIRVREIYQVLDQVWDFYREQQLFEEYYTELEYLCIRYILGSSFKRASRIQEKEDRKVVLDEGWNYLNTHFPDWKKNDYLKEGGLRNLYFRWMNPCLYALSAYFFKMRKWS